MKIGDKTIGVGAPYLIAEASINHNGDIYLALNMVAAAARAGCDAVKFQTYKVEEFCHPDDPMFETFRRCELPDSAWAKLKAECDKHKIEFLSTPQNKTDLELLLNLDMKAIKIGSDDACNYPLLKCYSSYGIPLIVSTGMCNEEEIFRAEDAIDGYDYCMMVCSSQYPTLSDEVNISRVRTMRDIIYPRLIGFSDHTYGSNGVASIMAVANGAAIIERHFTLCNSFVGPEHLWVCSPSELEDWVQSVDIAYQMIGSGKFELTQKEMDAKRKYQRVSGNQIRGMDSANKTSIIH